MADNYHGDKDLSGESDSPITLADRGRTAITRTALSRPLSLALSDGLVHREQQIFDYGCGRGTDVAALSALGYAASGWDPVHFPAHAKYAADLVNLGYVLNVIEDPAERQRVLLDAWHLTKRALVVSARLDWEPSARGGRPHADGIITATGTFQKYFTHQELQSLIDGVTNVRSMAAAPGVFYVFREEQAQQIYLSSQYVQRRATIRVDPSALLESHREVLEPLLQFLADHGRVPDYAELTNASVVASAFGSIGRAYRLVARVLGTSEWESAALKRQRDLLVYVAMSRFGRRPKFSSLPLDLQRDIKSLFGSYAEACKLGDSLLFAAGQTKAIDSECRESKVGKLTPDSLYIHVSALSELSPLLRVYEGCARTLVGSVEGVTLAKLRRDKAKVSYLVYPDFDTVGHPEIAETFVVDLPKLRTYHRDYRADTNRPVLHRKETFVLDSYPLANEFRRLTACEEAAGLLDQSDSIGFAEQWSRRLSERNYQVKGHRLTPSGE